jgi:transposase InsO family protein
VLYIFIILGLQRRRLVFANVTTNPTAEWLAQQVVNAFPWDTAQRFLIRDRDRAYGLAFSARVRGLSIREIRTAVRAPRRNAFAERVIGTLRRECCDYLIVLNERHAQRLLGEFRDWYHQDRVHMALENDAPEHRPPVA